MSKGIKIVLIIGPLLLGTYLSTLQNLTDNIKIIIWVICLLICVCGISGGIKKEKKEKRDDRKNYYKQRLSERHESFRIGKPISYINGLGENPLLNDSFNEGKKYQEKYKFKEAIIEFKKCLSHPEATESNRVAANILIGNCYHALSKLKDAQKHYKKA